MKISVIANIEITLEVWHMGLSLPFKAVLRMMDYQAWRDP